MTCLAAKAVAWSRDPVQEGGARAGVEVFLFLPHYHLRPHIWDYADELNSTTMLDYALCVIFTILVSFCGTNALFASKARINVVWNFFEWRVPKGTWSIEKISNNVDFSLWGNRATTWEYFLTFSSETKIMKIIHSALSIFAKYLTIFFNIWCQESALGERMFAYIELGKYLR